MKSKENLLPKEGNPESLLGRGSLLLPRAHGEDSLVCSQGHCCGYQGAPGLLPSKASSHSLHSDHNPVCWNPQHVCNKALWAKENILALNTASGLTQLWPRACLIITAVNLKFPDSRVPFPANADPSVTEDWIQTLAFNERGKQLVTVTFRAKLIPLSQELVGYEGRTSCQKCRLSLSHNMQ